MLFYKERIKTGRIIFNKIAHGEQQETWIDGWCFQKEGMASVLGW